MNAASRDSRGREATAAALRRWSFGEAVLDERTLELRVRGELTELERKPLEVLIYLLLHAGEVVTKDELAEALWPGRILTETVLTRCISLLRQALHDEHREQIKTVHGYGYRLLVPVSVETLVAATPALPPCIDFKPGDTPPLRPQWRLEQRLGGGGHGEVWLGRHGKTHEARVYKFALGGVALTALKREITLYRLLHDSLGERPDLVRIIDWNLRESPYFIESEFCSCGSLLSWAAAQGGVDQLPLAMRLELLAQVADSLAAAHAVGVLHKDLKPANVLVVIEPDQAPRIKLTDFGSGGLLEPGRLDSLGITRLGFTRALAANELTSGTPLYLAPEVMAGQPSTVQADIYALGVMLYQLCVGDLARQLAPGWEHDIDDELLREDIALAADGNRSRRLADAAELATRLRSLDARRRRRSAERAAQAELEQARRGMERLRARRSWMLTAMAVLVIGLGTSLWLYLDAKAARNQALSAAATSKAVSDFLNQDLLAGIDLNRGGIRDLSVTELLERAARQADERFSKQPEAAAQVHVSIGSSYGNLGLYALAREQFQRAATLFEALHGRSADTTLQALRQVAGLDDLQDRHAQAMALYEEIIAAQQRRYGLKDPRSTEILPEAAWAIFNGGAYRRGAELLTRYIDETGAEAQPDLRALAGARSRLASFLFKLGDYARAEPLARRAIAEQTATVGAGYMETAVSRIILGGILTERGEYAAAEDELLAAQQIIQTLVTPEDPFMATLGTYLGRLRMEQGRVAEGTALLARALKLREASLGAETGIVAYNRYLLAEAWQQQGRQAEAVAAARQALAASEKSDGPAHPVALQIRIGTAGLLRAQGLHAEAWATLKAIPAEAMAALPAQHPLAVSLRREQGLLWRDEKNAVAARTALQQSLQLAQRAYGAQHWRSLRAAAELDSMGQSMVASDPPSH